MTAQRRPTPASASPDAISPELISPEMNGPEPTITAACAAAPELPCTLASIGEFFDRSGRAGTVSVHRCARCGVGVTRPPMADVSSLYADRSSQDFQGGTVGLSRLIKTVAFRNQARRLLAEAGGEPRRVLDYGCGSGLFTSCLQQVLGRNAEVLGADFHAEPPHDLGAVAYRSSADLAGHENWADLLISLHVVEHDDDPHALLRRMLPYLRRGGLIAIEVPHIDCIWAGVFGRFWDAWYLPYHRIHFSRTSLRALVRACGLEMVRETDVSVPTMGRTAANLLGRKNNLLFILLGAGLHPLQWAVERLTRRPTALRVLARKL